MKTTLNAKTLKTALKTAKIYATEKSPWPANRSILIQCTEKEVAISSTDMEHLATVKMEASTTEAGEALLTSEAVKTLEAVKSDTVTIEATEDAVTIKHGFSEVVFTSEALDEYRRFDDQKGTPLFSCSGKDLERLVRVVPFVEKDTGRYSLQGVLIDLKDDNKVYSVATDGRRMGVQEIEAEKQKSPILALLPTACDFSKVAKVFCKSEKVTIYTGKRADFYHFFDGEKEVVIPEIQGRFPEWRLGMSQLGKDTKKAVFPACELAKISEFKTLVTKDDPGVYFRQLPGVPFLAVTNKTRSNETYINPAKIETFDTCKINLFFLLDLLKIAGKEELKLEYRDYKSGYLFSIESGFRYLVMPMHGETATQATKRLTKEAERHRTTIKETLQRIERREKSLKEAEEKQDKKDIASLKKLIKEDKQDIDDHEKKAWEAEKEIARLADAVKKEAEDAIKDAEKAEYLKKEWGEKTTTEPETTPAKKTAKKAPTKNASTATATNTPTVEKAPETQAEGQKSQFPIFYQVGKKYFFEKDGKRTVFQVLSWNMNTMEIIINANKSTVSKVLVEREGVQVEMANLPGNALATMEEKEEEKQVEKATEKQAEKEETTEPKQEKRVKIAAVESSAPLATVTPSEPAERPSVRASEPAPVESAPLPSAPAPAEPMEAPQPQPSEPSRAEKPFEIGTYTTKKGKVKTAIKFFQPPTPAQIDALKTAFYWEFNGTWNGSPRKLPEIFKR